MSRSAARFAIAGLAVLIVVALWLALGSAAGEGVAPAAFWLAALVATIATAALLVGRGGGERRQLEVARQRLAAVVESSDDAIIGQTLEGTVTDWNRGAERLFGYTAEEAVGRPMFETVVPAERRAELLAALARVEQGERVDHFVSIRRRKDGRRLPVSIRLSPVRDDSGAIVGAAAIDRDMSQQVMAERRRNARLAVTQTLADSEDLETAAPRILRAVGEALEWDVGSLWRVEPGEGALRCDWFWHDAARGGGGFAASTRGRAFPRGESLPGRVWESGRPQWIADVTSDPGFVRASAASEAGLHGAFACPITAGDQFLGVLEFFSRDIQEPDEDLLELAGTICGQVGQFIERRRAEAELRHRERELSDFFDNATMGLHWVGPDGIILRANRCELELLGYTEEEYVGHHISEFHADEEVIGDILGRLSAGEALDAYPARMRCKDGSIRHVLINSNVRWEEGRFLHTRCFTRDVSDRKRMEDALRFLAEASRTLASLHDSRSTLQKIAQLAVPRFADWCVAHLVGESGEVESLAVGHADPASVAAVRALCEAPPPEEEAGGQGFLAGLRGQPPRLVPEVGEEELRALASGEELERLQDLKPRSYLCVPLELQGRRIGSLTFVYAESGRRYRQDDLEMAADLANRASVAIENARLYDRLRDADRRKDEFLAMLSHELRNPLAPIRHGLEILALRHGQDKVIRSMQNQIVHLVRLVDDLLDVSRILRGRVELRRETVALAEVVRQSVAVVEPQVAQRAQELVVSVPDEPIFLHGDRVRLVQVVENLLANASKYTEPEGRIELEADAAGDEVRLTVRDSGIGIEPDLLPHVFDLFTQSPRSLERAQGGLGIGLTLVQRLVTLHGGSVSAHSAGPGEGSEFTIRLPRDREDAPAADLAAEGGDERQRRILVVDDNVEAADMLTVLLETLGDHQVTVAHDGESALRKVQEAEPEIVLLDIGLPGLDGYQVCRTMRQDPRFDGTLVVAVTGYGQEEDRRRSRDAGFAEHLVKPVSLDQLERVLSHPMLDR